MPEVRCSADTIMATVKAGTAPLTYSLQAFTGQNEAIVPYFESSAHDTIMFKVSQKFWVDAYARNATCEAFDNDTINFYDNLSIDTLELTYPSCTNDTTGGRIIVKGVGGTKFDTELGYIYAWGNSVGDTTMVNMAKDLGRNKYNVTIFDKVGCSIYREFNLDTLVNNTKANISISKRISGQWFSLSDDSVCWGDTLRVTASSVPSKLNLRWLALNSDNLKPYYTSSGNDTMMIVANQSRTFHVYAGEKKEECHSDSARTIYIYPYPSITIDPVVTIGKGDVLQLNPTIGGDTIGFKYRWLPEINLDNSSVLNPYFQFKDMDASTASSSSFQYVLWVNYIYTCEVSATTRVNLAGDIDPQRLGNNAFTPNGDGFNDFWYIRNAENYPNIHVEVFNRWGQKVYDQKGYDNASKVWRGTFKGKDLTSGTYFYVITINSKTSALTGTVTIIR
jgi:gliding motility-associated-like protein